jgi:thiamine-phosphate pyrophosphorylase
MNGMPEQASAVYPKQLRHRLSVYVVTDERPDIEEQCRVIEQALQGGATAIQLRKKQDDGRVLVRLGHRIRTLTHRYNALYIVNDRVDIALLTGADGVHVGQSDISCLDVRRLFGNGIVGVSVATVAEAQAAFHDGADYIGVGAIFPTPSKTDADLCGLKGLAAIANEVREIPIVAIGGITLSNATGVLSAGADGLAVVSAVMQAIDPVGASREFGQLIQHDLRTRRQNGNQA